MNSYLADINEQAEDMLLRLVNQMAGRKGVTEQLKSDNPIEWIRKINNIRNRIMEVINAELIFV